MKPKTILSLSLLISHFSLLLCQVPQAFNYQAVARNSDGEIIVNQTVPVRITIQSDSLGGTILWQEVHGSIMTNSLGALNLYLGKGARQSSSTVDEFTDIDWTVTPKFIKTEVDLNGWKDMGSSRLLSVPYSMVAAGLGGSLKKLSVEGETSDMEEPLFEVRNKDGYTVFAVYNEGVRVYVDDGDAKGLKGGFAIGGIDAGKTEPQNYFVVTPDSIRAYFNDGAVTKPVKGGFAIGGFNTAKGDNVEYFRITDDSTRIYINETEKAIKGGFAIGGLSGGKEANVTSFTALTPKNYFIGHEAGGKITSGLYNSFLGYQAGRSNTDGAYNIFIGYQSGYNNLGPMPDGYVGGQYGSFNCYLGYHTGYESVHGAHNTFVGYSSGSANQADNNTFLGSLSGSDNTSGSNNTFIGTEAGTRNKTGTANTLMGRWAGWNLFNGNNNTVIGTYAGADLYSGNSNVIIGDGAMADVFYGSTGTASSNVIIGFEAGKKALNGSNNIFIGYQAGMEETGSGLLYIDNSSSPTPLVYGNFETNEFRINGDIEYTGTIGTPSDARLKENISELTGVISKLGSVRGVCFDWIQGTDCGLFLPEGQQIGIIAQELEEVYPELVMTTDSGYKMVDYTKLTPVLLEAIKEQQKSIELSLQENQLLRSDLQSLRDEMEELKSLIVSSESK